jgi:NAD(P)-dependent dehydrogenase (short-subunit alcohol dehydrogenase family)
MSKGDWDSVIRTNLDSVFNMTKQVMDGMVDRGWGRVVNVSSVNGSKGAFGQTNYSAAKARMHGFTKALALKVARKGVTVNTISPGYIGTKMVLAIPKEVLDTKILPQIPLGRLGAPEEIAGLIIYLCSDEAAFVTGARSRSTAASTCNSGRSTRSARCRFRRLFPDSGSLPDPVRNDLLAAPIGDNDVGRRSYHVMWRDD